MVKILFHGVKSCQLPTSLFKQWENLFSRYRRLSVLLSVPGCLIYTQLTRI